MSVSIIIGAEGVSMEVPKTRRDSKGRSLIAFPADYCIVDLETTGLSPGLDEIIEIGAIRYSNGQEAGRFQSLVRPDPDENGDFVNSFIAELTGITNEMLVGAPSIGEALPAFADFLGGLPIVGYNVSFDVNFLYDNFVEVLGFPLRNDYIDVLRMARKLYPDMPHHRLGDMVDRFQLDHRHAHRAIGDCEVTSQLLSLAREDGIKKYGTEAAFIDTFKWARGGGNIRASDIQSDASEADPDSPIYGKHCVITGTLEKFTRRQAMQLVADLGGINEDRVTKKTNLLILGNNDYRTNIKGGKSSKQKTAEKYKLEGQDIEIVPETVFYDMLGDGTQSEKPEKTETLEALSREAKLFDYLQLVFLRACQIHHLDPTAFRREEMKEFSSVYYDKYFLFQVRLRGDRDFVSFQTGKTVRIPLEGRWTGAMNDALLAAIENMVDSAAKEEEEQAAFQAEILQQDRQRKGSDP